MPFLHYAQQFQGASSSGYILSITGTVQFIFIPTYSMTAIQLENTKVGSEFTAKPMNLFDRARTVSILRNKIDARTAGD